MKIVLLLLAFAVSGCSGRNHMTRCLESSARARTVAEKNGVVAFLQWEGNGKQCQDNFGFHIWDELENFTWQQCAVELGALFERIKDPVMVLALSTSRLCEKRALDNMFSDLFKIRKAMRALSPPAKEG